MTPVEVDWSDQDYWFKFWNNHDSFIEVHNTIVESEENPLDLHWIAANWTALINNSYFGDEFTTVVPGEGNIPLSVLNDCRYEELPHPHLFLTGKLGYQVQCNCSPFSN